MQLVKLTRQDPQSRRRRCHCERGSDVDKTFTVCLCSQGSLLQYTGARRGARLSCIRSMVELLRLQHPTELLRPKTLGSLRFYENAKYRVTTVKLVKGRRRDRVDCRLCGGLQPLVTLMEWRLHSQKVNGQTARQSPLARVKFRMAPSLCA